MRNAYRIFVNKLKGKRPLGRPRQFEIGWEGVEWIHLAQDRDLQWTLINMVMNLQVP
jgi:hypothetical protein